MSNTPNDTLGFKQITEDNWLTPDLPRYFHQITAEFWLEACTTPQLHSSVPKDICALFECARSMYIYGFLFYPIFTLGAQQCHRVAEAAVAEKCEALGLPSTRLDKKQKAHRFTFAQNIKRLLSAAVIPPADEVWWESTRKLRNRASHPEMQMILPPGMVLAVLQFTAKHINLLFPLPISNAQPPTT